MARMHIFEFEDLPWFPDWLRTLMTEYLDFMGGLGRRTFVPFVRKLHAALERTGDHRLLDLCSGSGGPSVHLARLLRQEGRPVELLLSDLYPNVARFTALRERSGGEVDFVPQAVDASAVPPELSGFRLICNAFHHFRPELGRGILADAAAKRRGIAVLEMIERPPFGLVHLLVAFLAVFLVTPFIRPFRPSRFLFTYLIPLVPLFVLWDGLVSSLRVYSPPELRALVATIPADGYEWDIGHIPIPGTPGKMTYLMGLPAPAAPPSTTTS